MPRVKEYIPSVCEVRELPKTIEYETKEDLLELDFIKRWAEDPEFYKFSYDDNHLLAELREGYSWYVVATVEGISNLGFPAWDHGRTKVTDGVTTFTVEGKEVASYCGNVVTMKGGRVLYKAEE